VEHLVEGLVGRYFPERQAEIRAFAEFLTSAGIERGQGDGHRGADGVRERRGRAKGAVYHRGHGVFDHPRQPDR